ncbi:uncharacterized protein LOC111311897 isoform X1 [Durio zibethinus]|uniref:Uncharacterized protein LOC111311897 isoform X1 n=1 Tax=Durio zibethinus TaxID=66656 RepID=A0A6P6ARC5_DURZI|nr:uncharacterized protein LOC111311897 isoform X1 [Durio zibethinus]
MLIRHRLNSRIFFRFLIWWIFFSCFSGLISSAVVTLDSIEIFNKHEWILNPTVYFVCKGENRTVLPDVTKTGFVYSFKGEESWQPLTKLESKKCKRCGFYEKDTIKSDDVYDEWEFCASDFKASDGKYILFKEKELNVTFRCPECTTLPAVASNTAPKKNDDVDRMHVAVVILISVLISTVTIIALVVAYKCWQKKKRQQDQARFLKLFEEGDEIEDELGLDNVI